MSEPTEPTAQAPLLTEIEARVLGCLVEKEATTPEQYPLTENSVTLACNQKTSRDPVLDLTPGEVGHALRQLEPRRLVRSVHGSRAQRYEHRFAEHFGITSPQQALLAVLMLRGPQTAGELLQRCERLHRFADIDELVHQLDRLAAKAPALVLRLPKAPGQREERYAHLLCGDIDVEALSHAAAASAGTPARGALEARIEALERRVTDLELQVSKLG